MTTTYDELRSRFIDGDTSVTIAQLEKARAESEYASLQAQADAAAAARDAEAKRQKKDIVDLRKKIDKVRDEGPGELQQAYADAVAAALNLRSALESRRAEIARLSGTNTRLKAGLDLPGDYDVRAYMSFVVDEISAGHPVREHSLSPDVS